MNRLISVLITLFLLFLVYLWISHITGDNTETSEPKQAETRIEKSSPPKAKDQVKAPIIEEQEVETKNEVTNSEQSEQSEPPSEPPQKPQASSGRGAHMVIAGNFLERANANKHLDAIKGLGFTNAEILEFEISEYYTVCAGRYSDLSEARSAVRRIMELPGMDAYVRNSN